MASTYAFPRPFSASEELEFMAHEGMAFRDYVSIEMLKSIISEGKHRYESDYDLKAIVSKSIKIADELIIQLYPPPTPE